MRKLCPLLKKACIEHQCAFYTHVVGTDPQTGGAMDHWDCAVKWLPVLLIEGAQQTRQAGAAIESFRNEMVKANDRIALTHDAPGDAPPRARLKNV